MTDFEVLGFLGPWFFRDRRRNLVGNQIIHELHGRILQRHPTTNKLGLAGAHGQDERQPFLIKVRT